MAKKRRRFLRSASASWAGGRWTWRKHPGVQRKRGESYDAFLDRWWYGTKYGELSEKYEETTPDNIVRAAVAKAARVRVAEVDVWRPKRPKADWTCRLERTIRRGNLTLELWTCTQPTPRAGGLAYRRISC